MEGVLLLNNTYEPLGVVNFKRAVKLLFSKKAEIVHATDRDIHSEKLSFPLPSVLRLLYYVVRSNTKIPLTKKNVLLRDNYRCAYCDKHGDAKMTVDHVIPCAQGGKSAWANLVACCAPCNQRKRDRTPHEAAMPLRHKPHEPRYIPWVVIQRHTMPGEWGKYLSTYNVSIEERVE